MTIQDQVILALTIWRENRGGQPQPQAMQSVANVIMNRTVAHGTDVWSVCTKKAQFSSLTSPGDPELTLWPFDSDPQWIMALQIAQQAASVSLADITGGAMDYYAPQGQKWAKRFTLPDGTVIPFPDNWNESAVAYTVTIGNQVFFRDV
jgi:hypothetical protein